MCIEYSDEKALPVNSKRIKLCIVKFYFALLRYLYARYVGTLTLSVPEGQAFLPRGRIIHRRGKKGLFLVPWTNVRRKHASTITHLGIKRD